jgi:type IX secretion system PorP/SprF family membrane protein
MKFLLKVFIFFLGSVQITFAFDPQFSMFYSVPLYINPAFAGSKHANRAILHHRWQWPNQAARFTTTHFGFDAFSDKYKSGIGASVMADNQAGQGFLGTNGKITDIYVKAAYAYELYASRSVTLRFGLEGGFIQRTSAGGTLPQDVTNDGITGQSLAGSTKLIPTIGFGTVMYTGNLYLGLTINHLNAPNISVIGNRVPLPAKYTLVGGYKIPVPLTGGDLGKTGRKGAADYMYLTPTFTYKHQNNTEATLLGAGADQVDLGLYLTRRWFIAGVWYRGIPFKVVKAGNTNIYSNESVVFLFGAGYNGFGFGYAYDLTVSTQRLRNTHGAHEINLTFTFKTNKKKGPQRALPCPDFEEDILYKAGQGIGK